jgi:polysaccharide biosynthesis/export protein
LTLHPRSLAKLALAAMLALTLAGCGTNGRSSLPLGTTMPETFSTPNQAQADAQLRLKPFDKLNIKVYQEPSLSVEDLLIDPAGGVMMPMLGEVPAVGKTPGELARDIERRYAVSLLRKPQVTVERIEGVLDRVTVIGQVKKPGVFPVKGPVTLIDAISLAEGLTPIARLGEVAIIRTINGQRAGALFSLADIQNGTAEDPAIFPSDRVVVGTSAIAQGYRDLLQAAPLLYIFTVF